MPQTLNYLVVGCGLAGTSVAANLVSAGTVAIVGDLYTSPSGEIPAGLFNPLMTKQASRVWRAREALNSLNELAALTGSEKSITRGGIFRPAQTPKQQRVFTEAANISSDLAEWLPASASQDRFPSVQSKFGGLWIRAGGAARIPELAGGYRKYARDAGAVEINGTLAGWSASERFVEVRLSDHDDLIRADKVILCVGAGFEHIPQMTGLKLHRIKGQVVSVAKPEELGPLPGLSGSGYVVDLGTSLVVGSSYAHRFASVEPERTVSETVLAKASQMLPALEVCNIQSEHAGIRVTVPGSYLPMVGPIDEGGAVWVVTGLGSKGVLMSAWIGRRIADFILEGQRVPDELAVKWLS